MCHSKNSFTSLGSLSRIFLEQFYDKRVFCIILCLSGILLVYAVQYFCCFLFVTAEEKQLNVAFLRGLSEIQSISVAYSDLNREILRSLRSLRMTCILNVSRSFGHLRSLRMTGILNVILSVAKNLCHCCICFVIRWQKYFF